MKINDFNEKDRIKKIEMKDKLKSVKLENVRSMWYLVRGGGQHTIVGSKGS